MSSRGLSVDAAVPVTGIHAAAMAWRYRGEIRVSAIAKATFAFADDATMPLVAPAAIARAVVHHRNQPMCGVRVTSDLVPYLKRADVLFSGDAHAPSGSTVERMHVRLALFDGQRPLVDKTLRIEKAGGFQRLAVTYENAYGGVGFPDNPFGTGFQSGDDAPSVLDPADPTRPAGLEPIAALFPARTRLLRGAPAPTFGPGIAEIPDGLDWDYLQAAPVDQRTEFLRGDEWIVLEGLHPTQPRLRMRLPGARAQARIYGLASDPRADGKALAMNADMLHVLGDEQRCTLTWRGSFAVPDEGALALVRIAVGVELPGAPVVWPEPAELARPAGSAAHDGAASGPKPPAPSHDGAASGPKPRGPSRPDATLPISSTAADEPVSLPFRKLPAGLPPSIAVTPVAPIVVRKPRHGADATLPVDGARAAKPALPFLADPPSVAPNAPPTPPAPAHEPPAEPAKQSAVASPWAPAPPAPPPAPPPRAKRPPPKIDVRRKLYGTDKR